MKISIGLSKPNKFKIGARAISWWMGTEYSHVFIKFAYQDDKNAVFHAAHGQVHFRSETNFLKDNLIVREYNREVSSQVHDSLFNRCMDLSGEKYSVLQLAKILCLDIVHGLLNKDVNLGDSKGYICSELVGKLLVEEFAIQFNKPSYLLKPLDVDKELSRSTEWHV